MFILALVSAPITSDSDSPELLSAVKRGEFLSSDQLTTTQMQITYTVDCCYKHIRNAGVLSFFATTHNSMETCFAYFFMLAIFVYNTFLLHCAKIIIFLITSINKLVYNIKNKSIEHCIGHMAINDNI